jgi:glycosyltransferase involved in cell wall biosynthesis
LEADQDRRILVIGDAVVPTGFSRVLHSVLDRLSSRYEIHQLGINYVGDPHTSPWRIYPAGTLGQPLGFNRLPALLAQIAPQLIFMLNDPWVLMQYAGILTQIGSTVPCVAYFPVESDPLETATITHLLRVTDLLVTYTQFGAREVESAISRARSAHPELPKRDVAIVPHGVDRRLFYPLPEPDAGPGQRSRRAARRRLFPNRVDLDDAFIVLNANRNQPRKRIDVTMNAFARFSRGKPANVRLYLHMARQDSGWDIQLLAGRLGIADRLLVTTEANDYPSETIERLNLIYNACDVGVNTASSEGWGLVAFEHASTGAPQVVPRHTSQIELWDGAAELVEPSFVLTNETILTQAYYVSAPDVADALERLYADSAHRQALASAALRRVSEPRFDWDEIAQRWDDIFRDILLQRRKLQNK